MAPTVLLEYTKAKELKKKNTPDLSFTMMGKSQKFSQGYSSAVVPECRHATETMGESEGFGSSGRVDSEDSCAPKRKCIRLNADKYGGLNVPLQVISLSKISDSERKELEVRLRAELEQVQTLQKRISSRTLTSISGAAVSSSSNGQGKKCDHFGQNGTQLKRGITGRFESTKQAQPHPSVSSSDVMLMKQCAQLLKRLMSHQYGWVFNTPVDIVKLKIPDYYTVIKHPMDLGTIKAKIGSGGYSNPWGFVADVRLTFTNAMTYNSPGNDVHIMADVLSKFFETRWKPMEKKLAATDSRVKRETEATKTVPQSKKRKIPPVNHSTDHSTVLPDRVKPKMTAEEKQTLSRRLEPLLTDPPEHIINFLRRHGDHAIQVDEEEMEIGIDFLSDDTLLELRRLLDDYLREKQTGQQAKADPCEMEILNESGLSNSSMHPCKGNEPADEDVDIGGNDPPISSYPPVEIEKDTAPKSSKCSSSSSSSSDSGSSSSDSDSGSSSGSESGDRIASPAKTAKASVAHEAALDQEKSDIMNPLDINRTVDELDEPEHDARHKPVFIETDGCQEGENAPSERQVSPDKLYRAALLRSRFADTILKAREKALDQREKRDPEKQRREREELERQQREEKARLQAEAKAAEEARRRAEAEAAAEAKRKRELEREAARQALLKMEKTVEMNNSLILKDLEMLRTVPVEHGPSFVDEASPDYSPDALGGFKLGGSNPLEQLGLYMKVDDEDEEEAEPSSAPADDVEEGEID